MDGIFYVDNTGTPQGRGYTWGGGGGGGATKFGYNYHPASGFYQSIAGRKAMFNNRVPCVREYGSSPSQTTWNVSVNTAQEKCVCYSFQGDPAGMAAGNYQTAMITWLNNIPAGWTVYWVYRHEVQRFFTTTGNGTITPAQYVSAYHHMRLALNNANLATGVQVFITANFMGNNFGAQTPDQYPSPNDCDILTYDLYGDPGNQTSTTTANTYGPTSAEGGSGALGPAYDCTYPLITPRLNPIFPIIEAAGFADSWGILEVNAPLRNWDVNEVGRAAWQQDYIDRLMNPPMTGHVPPQIVLLWETPTGNQWNQAYGYNDHGGGTNGTNSSFSANPALSPMWDVWYPYINGSP